MLWVLQEVLGRYLGEQLSVASVGLSRVAACRSCLGFGSVFRSCCVHMGCAPVSWLPPSAAVELVEPGVVWGRVPPVGVGLYPVGGWGGLRGGSWLEARLGCSALSLQAECL